MLDLAGHSQLIASSSARAVLAAYSRAFGQRAGQRTHERPAGVAASSGCRRRCARARWTAGANRVWRVGRFTPTDLAAPNEGPPHLTSPGACLRTLARPLARRPRWLRSACAPLDGREQAGATPQRQPPSQRDWGGAGTDRGAGRAGLRHVAGWAASPQSRSAAGVGRLPRRAGGIKAHWARGRGAAPLGRDVCSIPCARSALPSHSMDKQSLFQNSRVYCACPAPPAPVCRARAPV